MSRGRLVLAALLLAGCAAQQRVDFGFATPAPVPVATELVMAGVRAEACQRWYARFGHPAAATGAEADSILARAVADSLAQAPGANGLANVSIHSSSLLLFFYNRSCTLVKGDAVRVEPLEEDVPPDPAWDAAPALRQRAPSRNSLKP